MTQANFDADQSESSGQRRATRRTRAKRRQSVYEGPMWVGVTQSTYRFGKMRNIWKQYGRRPSIPELVLTLVWMCATIYTYADPIKDPKLFDSVFLGGALIGAIWLVHVVIGMEGWAHPKPSFRQKDVPSSPFTFLRWLVFPTAMVLVFTIAQTNLALAAKVRFNEQELMTSVKSAQRAPRMREEYEDVPLPVGSFKVREIEEIDGAVRMITARYMTTSAGLAYSPNNRQPPGKPNEDTYDHIYGNWWVWIRQRE